MMTRTVKSWILFAVLIIGCHRPTNPPPEEAFREVSAPTLSDDLPLGTLADAINQQRQGLLAKSDRMMRFGQYSISARDYASALDGLAVVLASDRSDAEKFNWIKEHFRFLELYGGKDWGSVLLTGYFEPVISGSNSPTATRSQALYKRPDDLVEIDLPKFSERFSSERMLKGRLTSKNRVLPYFTRKEIDADGALKNRGLELCWVDPIDAFFLQIQGSGTIQLEGGETLHLVYADKNGQKYEPIGKFVKERLAPEKVTMQRLEHLLRTVDVTERDKLFYLNPSYVFFSPSQQRAITAMGAPATDGRTIASDPKYVPKGALAWLSFSKPMFDPSDDFSPRSTQTTGRFVMDQDTGGAITGTDHIDLFCGRGEQAKREAGFMQEEARIMYLVPK